MNDDHQPLTSGQLVVKIRLWSPIDFDVNVIKSEYLELVTLI